MVSCDGTLHTICRYVGLVKDAFDPARSGRGLFFSFDADITLTQQRFTASSGMEGASSLHARADSRFVWNKELIQSMVGELASELVVMAFIGAHGRALDRPAHAYFMPYIVQLAIAWCQQLWVQLCCNDATDCKAAIQQAVVQKATVQSAFTNELLNQGSCDLYK